jgi:hypothetical protein
MRTAFYFTLVLLLGCSIDKDVSRRNELDVLLETLVGGGSDGLWSVSESMLTDHVKSHRYLLTFSSETNIEMHLKKHLCIEGDYCWKPMRDWPGQYEIRVDGVLKPDGSGWDLWSGELTEEQPFPSYSHFILNTNTNQLHVMVITGSISDNFVIN